MSLFLFGSQVLGQLVQTLFTIFESTSCEFCYGHCGTCTLLCVAFGFMAVYVGTKYEKVAILSCIKVAFETIL